MVEGNSVAEDDLSQLVVEAVTKITLKVKEESHKTMDTAVNLPLEAAFEAAVASMQQAQSISEEDSVAEVEHSQSFWILQFTHH